MNGTESNDELEEQEVILGNSRKYKEKHRNDVRLNYDSDSSEEDNVEEELEDNQQSKQVQEDDMFASGEEDVANGEHDEEDDMFASDDESAVKQVQFQDSANRVYALGLTDEEEEEEDDDDEQDSETQSAPKIEAFNLDEESNEGHFDKEGNYVANKEEAITGDDLWLNDFKKSDI
ncbi:uncharacterized protein SPAPADRAFT_59523, partial [Spathaspora passalidarum NRRL Y-27907]